MILLAISLAPVLLIIAFIYFRDKYEKEPFKMLLWALFLGFLIVIPAVIIEQLLGDYFTKKYAIPDGTLPSAAYNAFIVASLTEEGLKKFVKWFKKYYNYE